MIGVITAFIVALCLPWFMTPYLIAYTTNRGVLDIPNARSLHDAPVPRGGGIAVAIVVIGFELLASIFLVEFRTGLLALAGGGSTMAALGWADDRVSLSPVLRLVAQIFVAAVVVLIIGADDLLLGLTSLIVIVAAINFFNFMDGADGLAIGVAAVGCALLSLAALPLFTVLALILAVTAGSACGFLRWNWHPAKIFMGDAGSYFLGFHLAGLAILAGTWGAQPLWFAIVFAPLLTDAALTIVRRLLNGERFWQAHRSHVYQRFAARGIGHSKLASCYMAASLLLGLIVVANVQIRFVTFPSLTFIAYALTVTMWALSYRASAPCVND